jgi:hypothetical protein
LSNIAPEGVPTPIAAAQEEAQTPVAYFQQVPAVKQGLQTSHVAGGSLGGIAAVIVVSVCNRYHWHVSDVDAVFIGSAALSAGAGLGHVFAQVGVRGAVKRLWRGNAAA